MFFYQDGASLRVVDRFYRRRLPRFDVKSDPTYFKHANVPKDRIFDSPEKIVDAFNELAHPYLAR